MRLVVLLLLLVPAVTAQPSSSAPPDAPSAAPDTLTRGASGALSTTSSDLDALLAGRLSPDARVSMLTMAPGKEVYSRFGHSAIRIQDPARDLDLAYNFGTFDFEQPGFVLRFLRGKLDYILDVAPTSYEFEKYAFLERPIVEQRLVMRPETLQALYDLLEENALPENRAYRYDFVRDNCSTRLLDAMDAALTQTGQPPITLAPTPTDATFRELLAPYIDGSPVLELGIDFALAMPVDRPASARARTFLPDELAAALDRATVDGRPLVARRDTVLTVPGYRPPQPGSEWPVWLGFAVLGLTVGVTARRHLRRPGDRDRPARIVDGLFFAVVGAAGTILLLLWVATDHSVTANNWNVAWAWPVHLVAAVAVARGAPRPAVQRAYFGATALLTGALVVGWAALPQTLPTAALPLALALAVRSADRALTPHTHPAVS